MVDGLMPASTYWLMCREWLHFCLYASIVGLRLRMFLEVCRGQHRRVWVLDNWDVRICVSLARVRSRDLFIVWMGCWIEC